MKLRTKLIPAFAAISSVAVVMPIVCTSCAVNVYDMLHPYTPIFKLVPNVKADSWEAANDLYFNSIAENGAILDDDFAYTWAGCFNNPESRQLIDNAIGLELSMYRFKIITWRTSLTSRALNFELACKVAGKVKKDNSLILNGKSVKTFNLEIHYSVKNTVEISFMLQKSHIALKDSPLICLDIDKSIDFGQVGFTSIQGSYTYNEAGQEISVNNYHSIESAALTDAEPVNEGLIVSKKLLFDIPKVGLQIIELTTSHYNIYFATNYFKNIVIKE